jgi:protein-disulfide isomerase
MRKILSLAALVGVMTLAGILWSSRDHSGQPPSLVSAANAESAPATAEAAKVPDMVLGKADAPLTVVEYASFTCPHCRNFHDTVFEQFKKNYIDSGKVKFVYREVYFDKFGLWAAMVARCGGEMKYFGISDMIYSTQKDWIGDGQEQTISDNLRKIGLKAGIAQDALDACMKDGDMAKAMVAAYQTNAQADGVEGTPTFLIAGEKHSGEMTYEEFAALLDAKLPK